MPISHKFTATTALATALLLSGPAVADQVFADDVIVDGSLCVGNDCANGEAFGFDTIRMKENNTRLNFEDTSSSASFPGVDWTLVANDSSNGGSNYFGIQNDDDARMVFRVVAGAPANALVVDAQGDMGVGTLNPVVAMHQVRGNTPTLRLEQDGSSGFTPQTFDMAANETNFFIRDTTNGSTLPFRIEPGAPTNAVYIEDTGDIGLGTPSPTEDLHVRKTNGDVFAKLEAAGSTGDAGLLLQQAGTSATTWEFRNQASSGRLNVGLQGGNTPFKIDDAANNNLLRLGLNGQPDAVSVTGRLLVNNTQLNVPDYVFADDYALRPLADVQAFIDTHQHLPEVPSAADIAQSGVDMIEMQMVLLQKVEELTLYTLDQEAKIRAQDAKLAEFETLKARLAQIETQLAD